MLRTETPKTIYLQDYQAPHFNIESLDLQVALFEDRALVENKMKIVPHSKARETSDTLVLNGEKMELLNVFLNGKKLDQSAYTVDETKVIIQNVPQEFELEIHNLIKPQENKALEGLYKSGKAFCTQNEPEGFRKITYFLDRPDVMSKFKTTIIADKEKYPYLLANGNKVAQGEAEAGRHYATWVDPFYKPCYLFALVAGDFDKVSDTFTTKSGKEVALEIFVDKGNANKTAHAMESLKKSMKWDEESFGLEYDLDIYMIVAVDSFNMGAMENKGLNIFNSAYVLARPETATDQNFLGIEGVIGHEYFHNWTGNRVTCRDWFQLTLKEGLTVFRDQEFSSDMNSRAVKRIQDVRRLIEHQFPEDAGAMAHPIRPDSYIEINNFYTPTVYEKGAEVIRMIHTMIGAKNFRKGIDKYFELFDGQAVTTEDFLSAMEKASGVDLGQFKNWYASRGTPSLHINGQYLADKKEYQLTVKQEQPFGEQDGEKLLHIPLKMGLVAKSGDNISLKLKGESLDRETVLNIKEKEETFIFEDVHEDVVPSLNRDFSAPVYTNFEYSDSDLIHLMKHDENYFNRYQTAHTLVTQSILSMVAQLQKGEDPVMNTEFLEAFHAIIFHAEKDPMFVAEVLSTPSEDLLNSKLSVADVDNVHQAVISFKAQVASFYKKDLEMIVDSFKEGEYKLDPESIGKRSLRNQAIDYLSYLENEAIFSLVEKEFYAAKNMTQEIFYLQVLTEKTSGKRKEKALNVFYEKWKDETLVMQKWLATQASLTYQNTIERLMELEEDPVYDAKVPNLVRSLIAVFAMRNLISFHKADGSGYKYFADKTIEVDSFNPQMASRMAKLFYRQTNLDKSRKEMVLEQLKRILAVDGLSSDCFEVVSKNIKSIEEHL